MMSKLSPIFFLFLFCSCSSNMAPNNATINFNQTSNDFGTIQYKKETTCVFEFSNPGKTMLIINDVKSSCGCTVPEWTKEPIRPGEKGIIKIKYDAAFPGVFHKTVEVIYNGLESPFSLEIKGEVEYPEEDKN